jgi:hypothetical protein
MKKVWWVIFILFIASCSSPKFVEYRGQDVFQGKGGGVETIDGIDFWTYGSPDRKFKVLGFIDYNPESHGIDAISKRVLINKVKKIGGDGLIYYSEQERASGIQYDYFGDASIAYSKQIQFIVVKYLD